jgi:hypothetical protein
MHSSLENVFPVEIVLLDEIRRGLGRRRTLPGIVGGKESEDAGQAGEVSLLNRPSPKRGAAGMS